MTLRILALLLLVVSPVVQAVDLVDDEGTQIRITSDHPTVVTLAPHLAELVFAINADEQLVGTVEWSNFPDAARDVPRIGDAFRIDFERVLGMQPDLVLAWGGGTPRGVIARLRELGLSVAVLTPDNLESVSRHVKWLGKALDRNVVAEKVAEAYREEITGLRARYADRPAVTVFYQISSQPLFTINGDHVISEVINLCGGRNVFADQDTLAPAVTLEAVLGRDPEVIVMGLPESGKQKVDRWRKWPELSAVRYDNLVHVDAEVLARATPRLARGAHELCEQLEGARGRLPVAD